MRSQSTTEVDSMYPTIATWLILLSTSNINITILDSKEPQKINLTSVKAS